MVGFQMTFRIIGAAALIVSAIISLDAKAQTVAAGAAAASKASEPPYDHRDLTGVWMQAGGGTLSKYVSFTPEYAKIFQQHLDAKKAGNPFRHDEGLCLPAGIVGDMTEGFMGIEILARGGELLINKETPNALYRIFLNRPHKPADELFPTFYGDSVGHWDGDVLVVDTVGLKSGYWLDAHFDHIPNSDQLHFVQRLQRVSYDTLENHVTIDDSKAFAKPFNAVVTYKLHPDWELAEAICTNERNVVNDKGEPTVKESEAGK
jgi:hypothetical protein